MILHAHDVCTGLDIAFDMHTRLYGTTFLNTIVPLWAQDDRGRHLRSPESRRRMRDYKSIVAGGGWERVVLLDHPKFPRYSRKSFGELARAEGRDATTSPSTSCWRISSSRTARW